MLKYNIFALIIILKIDAQVKNKFQIKLKIYLFISFSIYRISVFQLLNYKMKGILFWEKMYIKIKCCIFIDWCTSVEDLMYHVK